MGQKPAKVLGCILYCCGMSTDSVSELKRNFLNSLHCMHIKITMLLLASHVCTIHTVEVDVYAVSVSLAALKHSSLSRSASFLQGCSTEGRSFVKMIFSGFSSDNQGNMQKEKVHVNVKGHTLWIDMLVTCTLGEVG